MKDIHILVPELPESINQATVVAWHKNIGDIVKQDEVLVEIETEKVILEVPSHTDGILIKILEPTGNIVTTKQILGYMQEKKNIIQKKQDNHKIIINHVKKTTLDKVLPKTEESRLSPSKRRILNKKNNAYSINIEKKNKKKKICNLNTSNELNRTTRIPITPMRKRISERLLRTINNTAMLTTFNEVNMSEIIKIRNQYCKLFAEKHGIKLGLMSFFVKSVIEALRCFPEINAKIDNDEMIYYKYFDINIAISTNQGLLTPILKDANFMTMAEIEKKIKKLIVKANEGKLEFSDLLGGNFTITNGGIFGSLLSTPIINPPQIAILGIHTIQERVISIQRKIEIAPMMYIALSYDHCVIDGKNAVGFLNIIKNTLEEPSRILLDI